MNCTLEITIVDAAEVVVEAEVSTRRRCERPPLCAPVPRLEDDVANRLLLLCTAVESSEPSGTDTDDDPARARIGEKTVEETDESLMRCWLLREGVRSA